MRQRLRVFWLWLVERYKFAHSKCYYCGKWGAEVCSLVYPKKLCYGCATAACRRADQRILHDELRSMAEDVNEET